MASARLIVALTLLIALISAGAWAFVGGRPPAGDTGSFAIHVEGPTGLIYEGLVHVENATALSILLAASDGAGFAVELEEYPGLGTYVRAIAGHRANGPDGWVYEVGRDGVWARGDRSAALRPLASGESVRWSWTA